MVIVWGQFQVDRTTQEMLEKARRKGLKTVAFVHDIVGLKPAITNWDSVALEAQQLKAFTYVLGLNEVIGKILQSHGVHVAVNLNMRDYVCATRAVVQVFTPLIKCVVFVGSLAPDKSRFIHISAGNNFTPLIAEYQAGLLISSLQDLEKQMRNLSDAQYRELAANAGQLGEKNPGWLFHPVSTLPDVNLTNLA